MVGTVYSPDSRQKRAISGLSDRYGNKRLNSIAFRGKVRTKASKRVTGTCRPRSLVTWSEPSQASNSMHAATTIRSLAAATFQSCLRCELSGLGVVVAYGSIAVPISLGESRSLGVRPSSSKNAWRPERSCWRTTACDIGRPMNA